MKPQLYTFVYALTLLLSALLLFSIQPLFSKMILPLLGGTPQVWNTAMLFFQLLLLAGYAYAHGTSSILPVRVQAAFHIILLLVFIAVLPIAIPEGWAPPVDKNPALWQLSVMALTVGGPFFVLAGSAPMLQRWFAHTDHPDSHNPYFLYAASNLGSMTALLSYPVIIEPLMNLSTQSHVWSLGYGILILLTVFSALLVRARDKDAPSHIKTADDKPVNWPRRFQWLTLAFIPSSLMLGTTTFITTDIASVPLLWILPLALYVGTFIIVFARKPVISRKQAMSWHEVLLALFIGQLIYLENMRVSVPVLIGMHLSLFFFSALVCHMELARARPSVRHLTEFYLIMALGGALGGFFNAIVAPNLFVWPLEYPLMLAAVCFMRFATDPEQRFSIWWKSVRAHIREKGIDGLFSPQTIVGIFIIMLALTAFSVPLPPYAKALAAFIIGGGLLSLMKYRWPFAILASFVLLLLPPGFSWNERTFSNVLERERNFFGIIKVIDTISGERIMLHGTTNHGAQALHADYRLTPLSYYSEKSPIRDAFALIDSNPAPQDVAVLGLGVGVTACFSHPERHFDFYEIDPAVVRIAENPALFTFLSDCGTPYDIVLGDGRLKIQDVPEKSYDLIVLDAFSSDNIPVHILTKEALEIYLRKLKDDGLLIANISNNYLDIEPVLTEAAKALGVYGYAHLSDSGKVEGTDLTTYPAHFFAMTRSEKHVEFLKHRGWSAGKSREGVKLWTDQYSNILSVLGGETARTRFLEIEERNRKKESAEADRAAKGGKSTSQP